MRLIVILLLAGAATAAPRRLAAEAADGGDGAAKTSPLWGVAGEKWEADGPFIDFSYAGALLTGWGGAGRGGGERAHVCCSSPPQGPPLS